MKHHKQIVFAAVIGLGLTSFYSCNKKGNTSIMENKKTAGVHLENMDMEVSPATNFYDYANGGWMKTTEIPDDESRWGSFNELRETNDSMTLALVDKALAAKNINAGSDEGKVVRLFNSAMNLEKLNKESFTPIESVLKEIDAINTKDDVLSYIVKKEPVLGSLFGSGVYADLKNSNMNALYLGSGSLGLPERDYYVADDEDSKDKRAKYVKHVSKMFQLVGNDEAAANSIADDVMSLETQMAKAMLTKEERRNPMNTYNPMTLAELKQLVSNVDWDTYYSGIGAKNFDQIIVSDPNYMKEVNTIFANAPISTIKNYFKWNVINDAASYLSEEAEEANFDFYGKTLKDLKSMKPRKERVLQVVNGSLGEALGKLYVAEYFPTEAKETAVEMVENVRRAYESRINNLDWMDDETKVQAIKKLNGMTVKIGYPDKWKDYSTLKIGDSYYQNVLNAREWNFKKDIEKIGKPVDKSEWFMSPQTVNAYYNPLYNEIVFPAAILQPPFFDYTADAAVNYGGMGAVIGHEISHGFDDQGAKFDVEGNMNNWWTADDEQNFKDRGEKLVEQYNAFEPLPGVFVNGTFTLGENIGDLGGVNAAYDGLQIHLAEEGNPGEIDGFTPEQRFFINWATVWRTKIRDEALKNQIKTDPHSPGVYRAVGPLVNVEGFYKAFNITPEDEMFVPEENRVKIW